MSLNHSKICRLQLSISNQNLFLILMSFIVSVYVDIQHAMSMRRIVICGLPRSETFFHII
jgi:hypothetical protein